MNSTQINKAPPTKQTNVRKNEPKRKKHTKLGERKPNKREAQHSAAEALVIFLRNEYHISTTLNENVRIINDNVFQKNNLFYRP
jgi:hypothetical protein